MSHRLTGLIAATFTPFDTWGELALGSVEKQAEHLLKTGASGAFICGSTGEFASLTIPERLAMAERWAAVVKGTSLRLVVHVGANCLADARTLAAQAESLGAEAIAALSPSYFKPRTVSTLAASMSQVAAAAPGLPFYFYDIPVMTAVSLPMPEFLAVANEQIPTFAGIKFTNPDLMAFQLCLHAQSSKFDVLWGSDEYLLAALALGGRGAVGSTYNFAAPIYCRMIAALERGDLATAREEQFRSVRMIALHQRYGFMPAAKALMEILGVPVGGPRLPIPSLDANELRQFREELETMGFFDWLSHSPKS